jgi:CRP-like cAMP-binding protein
MEAIKELLIEKIGLNGLHLEKFLEVAELRQLKKKDYLIQAGAICDFVGLITDGLMRSFVENDGEEYNTDFYFDNYFVSAYSSFITHTPTDHSIQAMTEVNLVILRKKQLEQLVASDPEWLKFGKYLAEFFLVRKCQREISFLKLNAGQRLAQTLITYPGIEQKIPQYHLASYLGIKPESLSRLKLISYNELAAERNK